MGELAGFNEDEEYYTQKVWFGSQPEEGGLTQAECDELAYVWRMNPEVQEHQDGLGELERKYLEFGRWLVEHGHLSEGVPDNTVVMHKRLVHRPIPHVEWHPKFNDPDDDLPPAA